MSNLDEGGLTVDAGPPRMAEMEDCAQRGCLRIAEVTVTHSVMTRATGSTATVMGEVMAAGGDVVDDMVRKS